MKYVFCLNKNKQRKESEIYKKQLESMNLIELHSEWRRVVSQLNPNSRIK